MKGLLAGAIIVDSADVPSRPDRVFVMNWLVDSLTADGQQPNFDRMIFSINGRSWPHTERLSATVGDSLRWKIINLNSDVHPVHLHGVYFRVDDFDGPPAAMAAAGAPGRMVVTERMGAFTTMSMTWSFLSEQGIGSSIATSLCISCHRPSSRRARARCSSRRLRWA